MIMLPIAGVLEARLLRGVSSTGGSLPLLPSASTTASVTSSAPAPRLTVASGALGPSRSRWATVKGAMPYKTTGSLRVAGCFCEVLGEARSHPPMGSFSETTTTEGERWETASAASLCELALVTS